MASERGLGFLWHSSAYLSISSLEKLLWHLLFLLPRGKCTPISGCQMRSEAFSRSSAHFASQSINSASFGDGAGGPCIGGGAGAGGGGRSGAGTIGVAFGAEGGVQAFDAHDTPPDGGGGAASEALIAFLSIGEFERPREGLEPRCTDLRSKSL